MVKKAVSNPLIHNKVAINVREKLNWAKDGGEPGGQHGAGVVQDLQPVFNHCT